MQLPAASAILGAAVMLAATFPSPAAGVVVPGHYDPSASASNTTLQAAALPLEQQKRAEPTGYHLGVHGCASTGICANRGNLSVDGDGRAIPALAVGLFTIGAVAAVVGGVGPAAAFEEKEVELREEWEKVDPEEKEKDEDEKEE